MRQHLTPGRIRAARILAIVADVVEISIFPMFFEGVFSPANDVLDVVVAALLFILLGWHWAFLPAFAAEMVPFLSLVPTWTGAVMLATRGQGGTDVIDVVPSSALASSATQTAQGADAPPPSRTLLP
jgi:hypothetical protein